MLASTEVELTGGDLLGWDAFRQLLARFAATPFGRDRALSLVPSPTPVTILSGLRETREARRALATEGEPPWMGLSDVRATLTQASPEGVTLAGPALAAIGRTLATAERLRAYGAGLAAVAPTLAERWRRLPTCADLAPALAHDLDPDGRLTDGASPRLRALRRQILSLRAELQTRLERLLDSPSLAPALQERYVTLRNGRYVLPIRDEARRGVRGIMHDRSSSGATVFIEPDAVIDLNNQLTQRSLEEHDEELRLLRELTRRVRVCLPDLEALADGLGTLDLAFARAALAERLGATEPEILEGGDLDLRGARHPLLVAQQWVDGAPPNAVVPIDVRVPALRPGLVISGPNAGGKTVALETCGLLVLMAQAGCHIPAEQGSRLPVCDRVLAVIGDDQSLAENLSTFSSFVRQMRDILALASPRSLVLLDELGASTDPSEGAALGAALLEALLDRGTRVIATTHLDPLKVFAQIEPRLENASVAFDAERLEPTFRLEYGHPGPSYALTIGERLGLPPPIIARARTHLSEESRRLETLLADLAAREREAEARTGEAARREAEAAVSAEQARLAAGRAESDATRIRREAHAEARALLADARRRVGHELDRLKAEEATRRRAREAYHRLRAVEAELSAPPGDGAPAAHTGEVQLRGLGMRGRIVAEHEGMVTVQAGRLTVRVARGEVEAAPAGPNAARAAKAPAGTISVPTRHDVPRELHLRGFTTDEARAAVEKFLDDAALAGHDAVRLVHGKGTGALKRVVETSLRAHPLVRASRSAAPADGGAGVTVVELVEGRQP